MNFPSFDEAIVFIGIIVLLGGHVAAIFLATFIVLLWKAFDCGYKVAVCIKKVLDRIYNAMIYLSKSSPCF